MPETVSNFTAIFLAIFIEAAPFLLLGTLASGLVEVFVSKDDLTRIVPRGILPATLMGAMLGFAFPVCECGVVPLTRRLYKKGFPVAAGVAFLLAAPIINPVALASTYAAYGFGDVLIGRFALGVIIPCAVGLIISARGTAPKLLLPRTYARPMLSISGASGLGDEAKEGLNIQGTGAVEPMPIRIRRATRIASDEFFEMARFLIIGAVLAALMQTFISRKDILELGSGPVSSVILMQIFAFVLSVCSTVDSFISLSFRNEFSTGSILAFLVFGPMVDIKSTLMFLNVFRRNVVVYLVILPFLLVLLAAVFINLNLGL